MDEDKFQYVTIALLVLLVLFAAFGEHKNNQVIDSLEGCPAVLDTIYEHCVEEQNITITTLKGHDTLLVVEDEKCVIRKK